MADWKSRATPVAPEQEQVNEAPKPSWKDRATVLPSAEPEVSKTESGLRGLAQGASMGFADELAGGAEALWEAAKGDPRTFGELYKTFRDESRANYKKAEEANPKTFMAGQVGGAVGTALIPGMGGANIAKLAAQGAAQGLGSSEADLTEGDIGGAIKDTAIGGTVGAATGVAGKALSAAGTKAAPYIQKAIGKTANVADDVAERLAVNATGATGKQAEKFAPGTGRELLDRGIVKAGRNAQGIADATQEAMDLAGQQMDDVLKQLDASGIKASVDNVVGALEARVKELSKAPGNEKIIKQLQGEIDNLYLRGESQMLPSVAEQAKRNFQGQVNYFSPEFEKKAATHAGRAFREEVEKVAESASPDLANTFKAAKKTYGTLSPVQEAAEARARQQAQSPIGGFGDVVTSIATGGGPVGAVGGSIYRRQIQPRLASTGAVVVDHLADLVRTSPQMFGRFAKPLQDAAQRGGNSLAATHFVLQQTEPEYRQMTMMNEDDDSGSEE